MLKKDTIVEIIGKDNIDICFNKLLSHFKESIDISLYESEHESLQLIKGQFEDLKKQKIDGTLNFENYTTEKNKIRRSIIEFVNDLPEQFWNPELQSDDKIENSQHSINARKDEQVNDLKNSKERISTSKKQRSKFLSKLYILFSLALIFTLIYFIYHLYYHHKIEHKNILDSKAWKTNAMEIGAKMNIENLEIESTVCNYAQFVQKVKLKPQTNYKILYSIKTKDVLDICQNRKAGNNKWGASVWITNDKIQLAKPKSYYKTSKWIKNEIIFNSKEANKAKLYLQLGGYNGLTTGYVQFKNVKMFAID